VGRINALRTEVQDVLHVVGHAFQDGTSVDLSGWDPNHAKNLFAGRTVYSIVLELPDGELLAGAGAISAGSGYGPCQRWLPTPGDGGRSTA
jgi:hypothetical protein